MGHWLGRTRRRRLHPLRVVLRSRVLAPGVRPQRRHRVLGPDQPPGLGGLRIATSGYALAGLRRWPLLGDVSGVHAFDLMFADRYAADGVVSNRLVRQRYDVPPPKPGETNGTNGTNGTGKKDSSARIAARSKASSGA